MKLTDDVLIDKLGFTTTTHDRCIHTEGEGNDLILLLRQVDDMLAGTTSGDTAEKSADDMGRLVKFDFEEGIPMKFLGLVEDHNGIDVEQHSDCIHISSKSHIKQLPRTHG